MGNNQRLVSEADMVAVDSPTITAMASAAGAQFNSHLSMPRAPDAMTID